MNSNDSSKTHEIMAARLVLNLENQWVKTLSPSFEPAAESVGQNAYRLLKFHLLESQLGTGTDDYGHIIARKGDSGYAQCCVDCPVCSDKMYAMKIAGRIRSMRTISHVSPSGSVTGLRVINDGV